MLSTALTTSWDLGQPVIQAPMAGVSGGRLAAAVSAAGGLGMIGVSNATSVEWLAEQAAIARGQGIFGIGLLAWDLDIRAEVLEAALEQRPFAISVSFGNVGAYAQTIRGAGVRLMVQVQSGHAARTALDAGADLVVAQGTESGGHSGSVGTLPLLQMVVPLAEAKGVPVVAAGGIATGAGLAGVLSLGAAGAWVGTRFAATTEALGTDAAKRRILEASETDTVHTHVFDIVQRAPWPDDFPGRALRNDFTGRWHGHEAELQAKIDEVAPAFEAARRREDYAEAHIYAGQAVGPIDDVPTAGEVLHRLTSEAEDVLRRRLSEILRPEPNRRGQGPNGGSLGPSQ